MRKNFLLVIVITSIIFIINFIVTPRIDYSKIEEKSLSKFVNQTTETKDDELVEEEVERVIIVQLLLDYENFGNIKNKFGSINDDNYKEKRNEHRKKAKEYHEGNNKSVLKGIKIENYQELYISKYSPFIDITYDYDYFMNHKNEILVELTNNKYVKEVRLMEDEKFIDFLPHIAIAVDASNVYNNRTKTGAGVVVGLLEDGVIKTNDDLLQDADITIRSNALNILNRSDHATAMAQIIAGTYGMAPGVKLLNAYTTGTLNAETEWMIDNDVDIINMSFGEVNTEGYYSDMSAYVDYIAYTYDIIMVASVGNNGGMVSNPGLGYNVISVGACVNGGAVIDYSAYIVEEGPIKPTIALPGSIVSVDNVIGGETGGTSASAAICSGLIALLLEDYPSLATDKARLIALIVTNAYESNTYSYEEPNGFDADTGGGMFSYQNIIDHYNTAFNYTNTSGQANTIYKSRQIYLTEGQNLRAAFASIAQATGDAEETVFTDYDIYLKDPSGNIVVFYTETTSNVMMVNYIAPSTGYYKLEIRQYSELRVPSEQTAFAYSVS